MNQLSFFDKIQVLFNLLISSPIVIGIFTLSLFLMIVLFLSSRLHKRVVKYIFICIYVLVIGFSIYKYGSYFLTSIDSFLTLFMANIYFPIIPIYVGIMIISFIIMIITLSGRSKSKVIKIVNTVFFTLIQMLFVVFIYTIETNNIDLSTNTSLYSNEQTMTLLESGMGLFVIWIILLLIIIYFKKADKIFKVKKSDEQNDFDEYINDYNEPNNRVNKPVQTTYDFNNPNASFDTNLSVLEGSFNTDVPILVDTRVDNSFSSNNMAVNTSVNKEEKSTSNDDIKSFMSDLSTYVQSVNFSSSDIKTVEDIKKNDTLEDVQLNTRVDISEPVISENDIVEVNAVPEEKVLEDHVESSNNEIKYNNIIERLVPESVKYRKSFQTKSVSKSTPGESTSVSISSFNENKNTATNDVFSSFQFLDMSNAKPVERKNDDVEVLDFD